MINYEPKLYNDHFQNHKLYNIPKAQLIVADIPYNLWKNAYASNPSWYEWWDNTNWESKLAGKQFFDTDKDFKISEFLHYASRLLKDEPKEKKQAPALLVFCAFDQQFELIEKAKEYWLKNYINLVFRKNYSAQVLKANMRIVWNCEYWLLFYRDKLPKFNNNKKMIMNCIDWVRDWKDIPKIHPTQKPVNLLEKLIEIFTDEWDVVIDMCAWSGTTLLAGAKLWRKTYWFEIKKEFVQLAKEKLLVDYQKSIF